MAKSGGKRAGAGPTGTTSTALQVEVRTNEEWAELLTRPGLTLVDVYSEWCGPCAAMLGPLRRIKMEIGGDLIGYAVARSEDVDDLRRFRGKSEPAWLFLENGKVVNFALGADSPRLQRLLVDEIRRAESGGRPGWSVDPATRTPHEETLWRREETARIRAEEETRLRLEAETRARREAFMSQMTFQLSEEIGFVFYPWVFRDENGKPRDKLLSPPYVELVQDDLFRQYFDVHEEIRPLLTRDCVETIFRESGVEITTALIAGLTEGKCMALRVKGRRPHPDWPVPYPHVCPDGKKRCPTRAIDDIENYLLALVNEKPAPLLKRTDGERSPRISYLGTYAERHFHVHEPDPEVEEDVRRIHPAVWIPPNARSKVHLMRTLFPDYMNYAHAYEEPAAPAPLCAFKFHATKFPDVRQSYETHKEAVERFGVFEFDGPPAARRLASRPEDFETKVTRKTGDEIVAVILRRVNDEAFYAFAGTEPYFVAEDETEARRMMSEYFPEGVVDAVDEILEVPEVEEEEEEYAYEDDWLEGIGYDYRANDSYL